jgi:long-chain acyl-CoA synthetase
VAGHERMDLVRGRRPHLGQLMERLAVLYGDRVAVTEDGWPEGDARRLTFRQAADLVGRGAAAIRSRVGPGQRVLVTAPNGYELFLLVHAAVRAGCVAVPVNPKARPDEIEHMRADSGAGLEVSSLDELVADAPADSASTGAVPATADDVAVLFYTSGTTGRPKGAQLTHRALMAPASAAALVPGVVPRPEVVSGLPVAHIAGFSMLVSTGAGGLPIYLLRRFRPDTALDAIESRRPFMFIGVPAMYRMMWEAGAPERDLRSVRVWASGADAMPFELAQSFQKLGSLVRLPGGRRLGRAAFLDGYGMVEVGGGVALKLLPPGPPLPVKGLLGAPMPRYSLKVVDDAGEPVGRGQVGELMVKGPGVMRGYHGQAAATDETVTPDGWVRTGDLARAHRLGLIEFAGRKKDVVKHGGYSVFPPEVEAVIEQHPAVTECAVVGLTDERKGQVPAAVVVLRPDTGSAPSEKDIIEWARERLADYKVPTRVVFAPELPRTGTDKVQKAELPGLFA